MKINVFLLIILFCISCTGTKFENKNDERVKIPIVEKKIDNESYLFVIDSGANISIIDSSFYHDNQNLFQLKDEIDLVFTGLSSQREVKSKIVYTQINNKGTLFAVSNIYPIIYSLSIYNYKIVGILGSDYLLENKLIIDYNNKKLR